MTLAPNIGHPDPRVLPAVAACQSARVAISHLRVLCRFLGCFQGRCVDGVSGASAPLPALHYQVNTPKRRSLNVVSPLFGAPRLSALLTCTRDRRGVPPFPHLSKCLRFCGLLVSFCR